MNPVNIREITPNFWVATQIQGNGSIPVTVGRSGRTPEAVLDSVSHWKSIGWIHQDAPVLVNK